jgi:hypothetical protein
MTFKNDLERRCFEIAQLALGGGVQLEHNKVVQIESALCPEVASFKGPPAKEVDVLIAELLDTPKVQLLVSCKLLSRPAEPAHVQEWGSVARTMNQYAKKTTYLGLVLSPTGFTAGSESWATSHNLGLVPPIKGRRITFNEQAVLRMFERVLLALHKRVCLRVDDLLQPPAFFDFVYRLVSDFEGHQETVGDGRCVMTPQRWASSFGEMYAAIANRTIEDLYAVAGATVLKLSDGVILRFTRGEIRYGQTALQPEPARVPECRKNMEMDACTLDFIKSVTIGKSITSAGDFGDYLEVGVDRRFNLGLHDAGFHLISTENPVIDHRL